MRDKSHGGLVVGVVHIFSSAPVRIIAPGTDTHRRSRTDAVRWIDGD
ncbi:hypothetical protein [Nocardia asiatica]